MKHTHLRRIILLGTVVLVGLLVVQVYWFNRAFDVAEREFDHSVQMALKKVGDSVSNNPEVRKLSSNFFFVETNSAISSAKISQLVTEELSERSLGIDFEFGVYNAEDDTLVYGHYIESTQKKMAKEAFGLQQNSAQKNFAVYFPKKDGYLARQLHIWMFSTLVLLLMMGFFAYAIASLLREKKYAALKTDFINNMTHEFKTPVTNIKIAAEILSKKVVDQQQLQTYINILLKENDKLQDKIDRVLSGASEDYLKAPNFETMDLHKLIIECAEAFELKVNARSGSLKLVLKASNTVVLGDKELLADAISNIIDNAEKYSPDTPHIVVRTKDSEKGIEINIEDNGQGVASNMKSKVFEKFFRVPSNDVHNVKGFGLGLNFAQQIINSHHGNIDLVSQLNNGTIVKIVLPKA